MAKKRTGQSPPPAILNPFDIVVDSREQAAYDFLNIHADADRRHAPILVHTRRLCLPFGDYSIFGMPGVLVERKSKADLYGSVVKRKNFENRLVHLSAARCAAVVVEAEWSEILRDPPRFTRYKPKSLFRTVLAWTVRFPAVHWWFMPGRQAAEGLTFRLLERYYKDRVAATTGEMTSGTSTSPGPSDTVDA